MLPRIICAPAARRSPGVSAFTVAWVPTGMNWGVSIGAVRGLDAAQPGAADAAVGLERVRRVGA